MSPSSSTIVQCRGCRPSQLCVVTAEKVLAASRSCSTEHFGRATRGPSSSSTGCVSACHALASMAVCGDDHIRVGCELAIRATHRVRGPWSLGLGSAKPTPSRACNGRVPPLSPRFSTMILLGILGHSQLPARVHRDEVEVLLPLTPSSPVRGLQILGMSPAMRLPLVRPPRVPVPQQSP